MLELQLEIQLEGQINLEMEIQNTEIVVVDGFDYFDINWINPTLSAGTLIADFAFSPNPQEDVTKIELWINGSLAETRMSNNESAFVVENINGAATVQIKAYNNDLLMQQSEALTLPVPVAPDIYEFSFQASKYVDIKEYCSDPQGLPIELFSSGVPTNGLVSIIDNTTIAFQPIDDSQPTTVPYTIVNSAGNTASGTISVSWEEIVITITSPTEAQEFTDAEDITVSFEVTPVQQNYISAIALVVDGTETEKRSPYSTDDFTIDAGTLTEASHTIRIIAYDLNDVQVFETAQRSFEVVASQQFLLDIYPNQFGESFALHRVNSNFSGDLIEIKRDNGDAQRFALDGDELPIATMSTFVGAGDGKVTWWKGQANGLEVSQTSDGACPLLFENGVLIEEKGKPALKFSGAQWLNGGDILDISNGSFCSFVAGRNTSGSQSFYAKSIFGNNKNRYALLSDNLLLNTIGGTSGNFDISIPKNLDFKIVNQLINSSNFHKAYVNNALINSKEITTSLISDSGYDFEIGAYNTATGSAGVNIPLTGSVSEIHIYLSDRESDLSAINNFINQRYNAYVV